MTGDGLGGPMTQLVKKITFRGEKRVWPWGSYSKPSLALNTECVSLSSPNCLVEHRHMTTALALKSHNVTELWCVCMYVDLNHHVKQWDVFYRYTIKVVLVVLSCVVEAFWKIRLVGGET